MDKCREAFEQIPEIKDSLSENIVFIGNQYTTSNDGFYDLVNWLNGAWHSFQEQQKRIDIATEALDTKEFLNEKLRKEVKEQQKRIDEQAKEINFLNNKADDLALDQMKTAQFNYQLEQKIDELQARVDDSIFILSTIDTPDEAYKLIDSLLRTLKGEQALKGGLNE